MITLIMLTTACTGDYLEELASPYYFVSESRENRVIVPHGWKTGVPYVPCTVEAYSSDQRFIIARQRVASVCFWESERSFTGTTGEMRFWIIDAERQKVHGPYEAREFQARGAEVGVPPTLRLTE